MASARTRAEQVIRTYLQRADKDAEVGLDVPIFGEGLGLDSLETAELSATLEDEHGTDPFSAGPMPQTVGDILAFYAGAGASS